LSPLATIPISPSPRLALSLSWGTWTSDVRWFFFFRLHFPASIACFFCAGPWCSLSSFFFLFLFLIFMLLCSFVLPSVLPDLGSNPPPLNLFRSLSPFALVLPTRYPVWAPLLGFCFLLKADPPLFPAVKLFYAACGVAFLFPLFSMCFFDHLTPLGCFSSLLMGLLC